MGGPRLESPRSRLESPRSDLIIPGIDGYVQRLQREDNQDLMAALSLIYKKPSASNKIFLMKKLFNLKMTDIGSIAEHLNEFDQLMSLLESVVGSSLMTRSGH